MLGYTQSNHLFNCYTRQFHASLLLVVAGYIQRKALIQHNYQTILPSRFGCASVNTVVGSPCIRQWITSQNVYFTSMYF